MKIAIVGAGNLATHLAHGLSEGGNNIFQIYSRNEESAKSLAEAFDCEYITVLDRVSSKADIVLIAVSDSALEEVSNALPSFAESTVVAHTAGSIPSRVLARHSNYGVFYPLQTFSSDIEIAWDEVPLLLTANNDHTTQFLVSLAKTINDNGQFITDDERLHLHLCAAIANNFANHMFVVSKTIADSANLDFNLLKPLIRETARKAQIMDPASAQTGPALRGDEVTMKKHLELLESSPRLRELYRMISASIQGD